MSLRIFLIGLIVVSCGSGSSFNKFFVDSEDKKRADSLFSEAVAQFDSGNFAQSTVLLKEVLELDPNNQEYATEIGPLELE